MNLPASLVPTSWALSHRLEDLGELERVNCSMNI
jgi:hypothetical protein